MTRKRTTQKITLVAVVAMLAMGTSMALAGAGSYATNDAAAVQETTTTPEETTPEETTENETANVTFEDQTSNGTAVVVAEVAVPEGGYVVIHAAEEATAETPDDDETETETEMEAETTVADGNATQQYAAGEVLGNSTYLEPGEYENVTVELDETLTESQVLIAMPHMDTNDNQQYEFPEADDPYTEDGEAVTDWANVTLEEDANETTEADEMDDEDEEETTTEEM